MHPSYGDYWPLFTTHNKSTIVKYIMEVLWPFWYGSLWLSKRPTIAQHQVTIHNNAMFDHKDGML